MLSTEGLTYLVFNRRERQQIRTREILYEKLFILISATKKKKLWFWGAKQQIHSLTDCQYFFWLDFLYHNQNHADNLCFNPRDLHGSEKLKTPEWLKIRNLKKLVKREGLCSGLIPQCWVKTGQGKKKTKPHSANWDDVSCPTAQTRLLRDFLRLSNYLVNSDYL